MDKVLEQRSHYTTNHNSSNNESRSVKSEEDSLALEKVSLRLLAESRHYDFFPRDCIILINSSPLFYELCKFFFSYYILWCDSRTFTL